MEAKSQSLRSSPMVEARSGLACIQVLAMALSSGSDSRMKDRETRTFGLRIAAHTELVMAHGWSEKSIVGMVNHHDKKKAMVTVALKAPAKRRDTWAEVTEI